MKVNIIINESKFTKETHGKGTGSEEPQKLLALDRADLDGTPLISKQSAVSENSLSPPNLSMLCLPSLYHSLATPTLLSWMRFPIHPSTKLSTGIQATSSSLTGKLKKHHPERQDVKVTPTPRTRPLCPPMGAAPLSTNKIKSDVCQLRHKDADQGEVI